MNREDVRIHIGVIREWANGSPVQFKRLGDGKWEDIDEPSWCADLQYRIKPKPRKVTIAYVPGNAAFEPIVQSSNCITFGDGVKYVEVELPE